MATYKEYVRGGSRGTRAKKRQAREAYWTEPPWYQRNSEHAYSNYHTSREHENLNWAPGNANNNNFSRGRGKFSNTHVMESKPQADSDTRTLVPQFSASSATTSLNKGRAHRRGTRVCGINKSQGNKDPLNFYLVTAEHEIDKADPATTASTVSKDELPATSSVDKLKDNDDPPCNLVTEGTRARINKDQELIRVASGGNVNELKNLIDLCHNSHSFQLSQEALESSLIQVVKRGQKFMVQLLVYAGAQPASNFKDKDGYTALLVAAEKGFTDIARFLLKKGANVNAINNNKDSALLLSVKPSGSTELVKLLLTHNANVNLENKDGFTALIKALEVRDLDTCKLLVDAGAKGRTNKSRRSESNSSVAERVGMSYIFSLITQEALYNNKKRQQTALMNAVHAGNVEAVRLLLDCQFTDVNKSNKDGTALMQLVKSQWSAKMCSDKLEIMKLLLQNRAVTGSDWSKGSSALFVATRAGRSDMVRLLCEHGVGLNDLCDNQTVLMIAAELGHLEVLKILLDHRACVNVKNAMRLNALLIALKFGQVECAKLLLNRGAHLDLPMAAKLTVENKQSAAFQFLASQYKIDLNEGNLLHLAVAASKDDIVRILLDMGADVNRVGIGGTTPLEAALKCRAGESLIRCLIKKGACVNASSEFVPLHLSMFHSVEMTRLLLESGADVNVRGMLQDDTALIIACDEQLNMEIVELLLAKGAQPNLQNKHGWTALHKAIFQADLSLIQLLVDSGADLEVQTHDNETAYLLAAGEGSLKIIQALQKLGADTSVVDSSGYNALMRAVTDSVVDSSALVCLAGDGAQINHKCNKGYTVLMLVAMDGEAKHLRTLLDLGADVSITTSVDGKETTALSILLEKSTYYSKGDLACMEELIKHGAVNSLPRWCSGVLHKMIMMDKRKMIQLLLTNGMAPAMSDFQPILYRHGPVFQMQMLQFSPAETSPLNLALASGNFRVAQYLAGNWALCPCDLTSLSQYNLRDYLTTLSMSESVKFVDKFCGQPASLLQLSFVAVSHALGGVPGREERVNSLPLPQIIKDKLMFRKEVVEMDFDNDVPPANLDGGDVSEDLDDDDDDDDDDYYDYDNDFDDDISDIFIDFDEYGCIF